MNKQYKLKGINQDYDTCEICGKTALQKVMWIAEIDKDGNEVAEPFPAGTTCGAKKLGLRLRSAAKIQSKITEMAIDQIKAKIKELKSSFDLVRMPAGGGYLFPKEIANYVRRGDLTTSEACKARNEIYPILDFEKQNVTLKTINEALKYI